MQARAARPGCWLGTRAGPACTLRRAGRRRPGVDDDGAVWPLVGAAMRRIAFASGAPISTSSCHGACSPALSDWGKRWPAEQDAFAAGLILSAAGDPVVERAVGRCLADLARLGRPLLWGVVGQRVRWQSRFALTPNGWPPEADFAQPL